MYDELLKLSENKKIECVIMTNKRGRIRNAEKFMQSDDAMLE
jgi:hypothetical protein